MTPHYCLPLCKHSRPVKLLILGWRQLGLGCLEVWLNCDWYLVSSPSASSGINWQQKSWKTFPLRIILRVHIVFRVKPCWCSQKKHLFISVKVIFSQVHIALKTNWGKITRFSCFLSKLSNFWDPNSNMLTRCGR